MVWITAEISMGPSCAVFVCYEYYQLTNMQIKNQIQVTAECDVRYEIYNSSEGVGLLAMAKEKDEKVP